ncbi:MAG: methyl-accepting chemotaxis protein [Desulfobacteraceae bacterium]|jgi:methyl-accepting chemotaxis protein
MLTKYLNIGLRQKLLILNIGILSLSVFGLALVLVGVQQKQFSETGKTVLSAVNVSNKESARSFDELNIQVKQNLRQMAQTVGESLAEATQLALEKEKSTIRFEWENTLKDRAVSLADLLAKVAPSAILANNFLDLIAYTKSATQNSDVVYAIYLKTNGKPLTRYLNRKDPIVQRYLKTGNGRSKIEKVINASLSDDSVFVVEKQVALEGQALGVVKLCISKSSADQKEDQQSNRFMDQLSKRFNDLIVANTQRIHSIVGKESLQVSENMQTILETVSSRNEQSVSTIGQVIEESFDAVKQKTRLIIAFMGGASIVTIFVVLFFFLTKITNTIRRIVDNLSQNSEKVASSSAQISTASQTLAQGSSTQAGSIEETSSSLEQMSSMIKQNANNAMQTDELMKETDRVVGHATESMTALTSSISEISKASEKTSKIIGTIDEIAFQTNLLALNAAVEAARAGELGAGFAVVADEVRNLALRAAEAAKVTADLIKGTVEKVKTGSDLVKASNEAFSKVTKISHKTACLVSEITTASNEQTQGIQQINKAVAEIDTITQQNAANAEESASASEVMSYQAEHMRRFVGELVTLVDGGNGNPSS